MPRRKGWDRATLGAAEGQRTQTHVETFYIIERKARTQTPFCWSPQSPDPSGGTRAAPTDGGGNWNGSLGLRVHYPRVRQASAGRSPAPLPLHVPRPASASGEPRLPAASRLCPGRHSPSGPAAGEAPVRRAKARTQRATCCPDLRRELGGLRGSGLLARLRAGSVGCAAGCCPGRGLRGPPAGVLLLTAGFFCARLCPNPHLSRRAPPYNKPTGP
jgi:hypothetical protein